MGEANGPGSVRFELKAKQVETYQIRDTVKKKVIATFYDEGYAELFLKLMQLCPARKPEPRVVTILTEDCRDAEWMRTPSNLRYRFKDGHWHFRQGGDTWYPALAHTPGSFYSDTFTEVID